MFVITKDTIQDLFVNLIVDPPVGFFLFVVTGNGLEDEKVFLAPESSEFTDRYFKFTIEESATEDLLNGVVSFPLASDLYCKIFSVPTESLVVPTDDDPIWRGQFRIVREATVINENEPAVEIKGYDPRS